MIENRSIRKLDLTGNKFGDKMGPLLIKLLQNQTECRDNIIWSYGLWGEKPENIDREGLKSIILTKNCLTDRFCKSLSWMKYDEYIWHIDLKYNKFTSVGVNEIVSSLKDNHSIVCLEVKGNPGVNEKHQ